MNWQMLNVKGGEWVGNAALAILAVMLATLIASYGVAVALRNIHGIGPWLPGLLIVMIDGAILVPAGIWARRRRKRFSTMTASERAAHSKARAAWWEAWWGLGWVRYGSAVLMLWGAVDIAGQKWWASVILGIYALIRAREVSLLLLAFGAAVLLFKGVAALPVSVAVIVGAVIIGSVLAARK